MILRKMNYDIFNLFLMFSLKFYVFIFLFLFYFILLYVCRKKKVRIFLSIFYNEIKKLKE